MAEGGQFSTTTPNAPPTPTSLPNSLQQPLNPTFAADPTYLKQMGAMNLASETTLSGDKTTLGRLEGNYAYQRELMAHREEEGYQRYGLRNFSEANTGFFQIGRANLAKGYSLNQARQAELAQQGYNKLGESIQNLQNKNAFQGGEYGNEAKARAETKALRTPTQAAPAATPTGPYPNAEAAVRLAFPGGEAEQLKYAKEKSKYVGRAQGGPVAAGKPYVVGEEGPEVIVPKTNGKVIPSRTAKNAQNIRRRAIERIGRRHG